VSILEVVLTIYLYFIQAQLDSSYKELINEGSDESTAYSNATRQVFIDTIGKLEWSGSYSSKNRGKKKMRSSMLNEILTRQHMMDKELVDLKEVLSREAKEALDHERWEAKEREDCILAAFYAMQRGEGANGGGGGSEGVGGIGGGGVSGDS